MRTPDATLCGAIRVAKISCGRSLEGGSSGWRVSARQSQVVQEWVAILLAADRRVRAMAGHHDGVLRQAMDIQVIQQCLTGAKELITSVMGEIQRKKAEAL
jgi:hypothetical protein